MNNHSTLFPKSDIHLEDIQKHIELIRRGRSAQQNAAVAFPEIRALKNVVRNIEQSTSNNYEDSFRRIDTALDSLEGFVLAVRDRTSTPFPVEVADILIRYVQFALHQIKGASFL